MIPTANGGIHGDDDRVRIMFLDMLQRPVKIHRMDRMFQCPDHHHITDLLRLQP